MNRQYAFVPIDPLADRRQALRAGDRRRLALGETLIFRQSMSHFVQTSRTPPFTVALSQAWMNSPSS
jgi:hypothetical protein